MRQPWPRHCRATREIGQVPQERKLRRSPAPPTIITSSKLALYQPIQEAPHSAVEPISIAFGSRLSPGGQTHRGIRKRLTLPAASDCAAVRQSEGCGKFYSAPKLVAIGARSRVRNMVRVPTEGRDVYIQIGWRTGSTRITHHVEHMDR